jgi:hypothetical protein
MSGKLTYWVNDGKDRFRALKLTVCEDVDFQNTLGLSDQRRKRLIRILEEAFHQGARLSYRDLSMIMLTSKATLKRDVSYLRSIGVPVELAGTHKGNGNR